MVEAHNVTTTPSLVQGSIGRRPEVSATIQDVLVLERTGPTGSILGSVINLSRTHDLVLTAQESADNDPDTANDGYDDNDLDLRVDGTAVSSITVPPGGQATFVIDGPGVSQAGTTGNELKFLRLRASDQTQAYGHVSLSYFGGSLTKRGVW